MLFRSGSPVTFTIYAVYRTLSMSNTTSNGVATVSYTHLEKSRHEDLPAFKSQNEAVKWYLKGLNESGLCLDVYKRQAISD